MSGTQCIGRMGGRPGDWRAELDWHGELDFIEPHATIIERGPKGESILIAEAVPIVKLEPENTERGPELDPSSATNKALMKIVFAPEAWATLRSIKADLERKHTTPEAQALAIEDAIDQIERTLECLTVPTSETDDGPWAPTTPSGDPISGDTRPDGPFQSGSGYGGEPR